MLETIYERYRCTLTTLTLLTPSARKMLHLLEIILPYGKIVFLVSVTWKWTLSVNKRLKIRVASNFYKVATLKPGLSHARPLMGRPFIDQ